MNFLMEVLYPVLTIFPRSPIFWTDLFSTVVKEGKGTVKKIQKRTIPETRVEKAWKAYVRIMGGPLGGFLSSRRSFRRHVLGPIALSRPAPVFTSETRVKAE